MLGLKESALANGVGNEIELAFQDEEQAPVQFSTVVTQSTQTIITCARSQLFSYSFLNEKQLHHFTGFTRKQYQFLFSLLKDKPRLNSAQSEKNVTKTRAIANGRIVYNSYVN